MESEVQGLEFWPPIFPKFRKLAGWQILNLHFGLGIAYFSDETGTKAGYLLPSDYGWEEFDQPTAGPAILEAISFYNRTAQKQATFVDLPFKTN